MHEISMIMLAKLINYNKYIYLYYINHTIIINPKLFFSKPINNFLYIPLHYSSSLSMNDGRSPLNKDHNI